MRKSFCALIVAGVLCVGVGVPAVARDHNGYEQIAQGNYAAAERMLVAERRLFPDRPELALNLAAIYRHTGRIGEAKALYLDVLSRPNEQFDVASDRAAWSHDIAAGALRGLDQQSLSLH